MTNDQIAALRAVSTAVDVPGAPHTLRLDHVVPTDDGVVLAWSSLDPESREGDAEAGTRRVRSWVEVAHGHGDPRRWWAVAQLDAIRAYRLQIDADWLLGEPAVVRTWAVDEAWRALIDFLDRRHPDLEVVDARARGDVRVRGGGRAGRRSVRRRAAGLGE